MAQKKRMPDSSCVFEVRLYTKAAESRPTTEKNSDHSMEKHMMASAWGNGVCVGIWEKVQAGGRVTKRGD